MMQHVFEKLKAEILENDIYDSKINIPYSMAYHIITADILLSHVFFVAWKYHATRIGVRSFLVVKPSNKVFIIHGPLIFLKRILIYIWTPPAESDYRRTG